jgi:hypothetical protein
VIAITSCDLRNAAMMATAMVSLVAHQYLRDGLRKLKKTRLGGRTQGELT